MAKAKAWLAREPKALDPEQARRLRVVLDRPDDDAARLVYADWLMQRGDPRGEFISLSLQAEALADGAERDAIRQRAGELLREHRQRWLEDIGWPEKSLGQPRFRKGFLDGTVDVLAQVLVPILPSLFAREPIRKLRVRSVKSASLLDDLLSHEELRRVEQIDFWGSNRFNVSQARKIASSPNLVGLRRLSLYATAIGPKGAKAFFDALALPSLVHLHLGECKLGDAGAQVVASARRLPPVLDLSRNAIGPAGVKALAASPALEGVETLNLSSNPVGDAGATALAASPNLRSLRLLRLYGCEIGAAGAQALAARSGVEALDLGANPIDATAVRALEANPSLKALGLLGCEGVTTSLPAPPPQSGYGFHGEG